MYQTVGQDAIDAVANALDVPLYRKTIRGTAIDQNTEYGPRTSKSGVEGDETEDLYELLFQVKVPAISTLSLEFPLKLDPSLLIRMSRGYLLAPFFRIISVFVLSMCRQHFNASYTSRLSLRTDAAGFRSLLSRTFGNEIKESSCQR
jgi:hypothetical protein